MEKEILNQNAASDIFSEVRELEFQRKHLLDLKSGVLLMELTL